MFTQCDKQASFMYTIVGVTPKKNATENNHCSYLWCTASRVKYVSGVKADYEIERVGKKCERAQNIDLIKHQKG